jgi:hypothetical protein
MNIAAKPIEYNQKNNPKTAATTAITKRKRFFSLCQRLLFSAVMTTVAIRNDARAHLLRDYGVYPTLQLVQLSSKWIFDDTKNENMRVMKT